MVLVAQNRPLTKEVVTEKITKTGNTPFVFENLEVTMDDDIFMPVNQLNQLRRGALEALEEALLKPYERTLPELVETSSAETDRQTTGNAIKRKADFRTVIITDFWTTIRRFIHRSPGTD